MLNDHEDIKDFQNGTIFIKLIPSFFFFLQNIIQIFYR